jgi:RNA polymerase sigma factor FliA
MPTAQQSPCTETVQAWWQQFRVTRDQRTRATLIEHYLSLARAIAARVYRLRTDDSVAFDDYLQYGRIGLMQAVDRFDPQRGIPFEAYASRRVRGAVLNGLGYESELLAQRAFHAARLRDRVRSLRENPLSKDRLEKLVHVTLTLALGAILDGELDEPVDESPASNPYEVTELQQLTRRVWDQVAKLPERDGRILLGHYRDGLEFQDIAAQMGLTKGRVSQLHAQALGRLRLALAVDGRPLRAKL